MLDRPAAEEDADLDLLSHARRPDSSSTEDDDLPLEIDAELLVDGVVRDADEIQNVRGGGVIDVDDEVRMFR